MNLPKTALCVAALLPVALLSSCSLISPGSVVAYAPSTPAPLKTRGGGTIVDLETGESRKIPITTVGEPSTEIVDSARGTFEHWLGIYSAAMNRGTYEVSELEPYTAGDLLASMKADDGLLFPNGEHTTGASRVVGIDVEVWDPETGSLRAFVCEDQSDVRLLDAQGNDLTNPGRPDRFESDVLITGLPDAPKVAGYQRYPELDMC